MLPIVYPRLRRNYEVSAHLFLSGGQLVNLHAGPDADFPALHHFVDHGEELKHYNIRRSVS